MGVAQVSLNTLWAGPEMFEEKTKEEEDERFEEEDLGNHFPQFAIYLECLNHRTKRPIYRVEPRKSPPLLLPWPRVWINTPSSLIITLKHCMM